MLLLGIMAKESRDYDGLTDVVTGQGMYRVTCMCLEGSGTDMGTLYRQIVKGRGESLSASFPTSTESWTRTKIRHYFRLFVRSHPHMAGSKQYHAKCSSAVSRK